MFDFDAINNQINSELDSLHKATPRVRTRRIDKGDYRAIMAQAFAAVQPDDVQCTIIESGGYVPNSYGWQGQSDSLVISFNLVAGQCFIWAARGQAHTAPHGYGPTFTIRIEKAGQRYGRYVH